MSRATHRTTAGIVVALLIVMGFLLFHGPRFSVNGTTTLDQGSQITIPDLQIRCGSVLTVGWPSDGAGLTTTPFDVRSFHVEPSGASMGSMQDAILTGLNQQCNERRDTYIAFLIILAIPVCLLGTLTIVRNPKQTTTPTESEPVTP